jgi:hypothetical protein
MRSRKNWDVNRIMRSKRIFLTILGFHLTFLLAACSTTQSTGIPVTAAIVPTQSLQAETSVVTETPFQPVPAAIVTQAPSQVPTLPTLAPGEWKKEPIVPEAGSERAMEIYQKGLALGNNPRAFSKVGDCESSAEWFLGDFDKGADHYSLGGYSNLQGVITEFQGSFNRRSLAAERSFTTASVLSPLWANPELCKSGETPLECEYRIQKPEYAIIMLGTNEALSPIRTFESNMRRILDMTIERGIVPILTTKADDLDGNGAVNEVIFKLAREYRIPLWNFWAAVQPLPGGGLQEDGAHLTYAGNRFDDPFAMQKAWPVRNLTALQVLDKVWRVTTGK